MNKLWSPILNQSWKDKIEKKILIIQKDFKKITIKKMRIKIKVQIKFYI